MRGFYTEQRHLPDGISLARDLAQHILMRGTGSVVVAAQRPQDLASITKKQWHILIRHVQRERSSTLRAARIAELSNQIVWMQQLRFTSKFSEQLSENSVMFATADELILQPPICSTLYIAQQLSPEQFYMITSWLRKGGVVVRYC